MNDKDTYIVVKLQVEGLHNWPEARTIIPEMGFLADIHRHIFHIKIAKIVSHNERDIEIILFKRGVTEWLQTTFAKNGTVCNFGPRSCETIANLIMDEFQCESVEVLEDNENGSIVIKQHQ
jgi:hypothetical protein